MKRIALFLGLLLCSFMFASPEADAARTLTESQKARLKRLIDTNGDGVISIPERGAARVFKGANRQQRALGKNERTVRKIK
jgi:hypothetical protein